MIVTANGVEIPAPSVGVVVLVRLDGDEVMGPIGVRIEGGRLRVVGGRRGALYVEGDAPYPWLELWGDDAVTTSQLSSTHKEVS